MKLPLSIAAIILSTWGLLGLIYVAVEKAGSTEKTSPMPLQESKANPVKKPRLNNNLGAGRANIKPAAESALTDEAVIKKLVELSEADLMIEHSALEKRLREEQVLLNLEQGKLSREKASEAKALLERFSLLSLESTRRNYLAIEPELKDPLFAHRDSIKDIRKMLERY